ncbi:MAG TPA: phosphotransferase family protein [Acidimicrobiia bacterium]|nr:phosphotransferase family protein [Acidimicrobiia bacterium]HEV3451161.1 phosphotransferase family protein [Acidimicrobiia bacterium]
MPPEGVDVAALRPWFAAHVEGASGAPLEAELIAGGRSNLTYVISDSARSWVLRRPPLGHVVETAHDMRREFRVLSALAGTEVPVPQVLAFGDDAALIGAPFYVMERVEGRILRTKEEMATLDPAEARACSEALVDVLAALHSVDYEAVGLADFGRPDGFLARNVARWGKQWQANKTRELPALDELGRRLDAALPGSGPPAVVHGDYRLDNTMLAQGDPGRIAAVLDWEMSTLGDPLTDVGLLLVYWGGDEHLATLSAQGVGDIPGFLSRDEIVTRYAERSGRDVEHLTFYVVFAMYKLAIIVEGIQARFLMGKTLGDGFADMGATVTNLAEQGLALADASDDAALGG